MWCITGKMSHQKALSSLFVPFYAIATKLPYFSKVLFTIFDTFIVSGQLVQWPFFFAMGTHVGNNVEGFFEAHSLCDWLDYKEKLIFATFVVEKLVLQISILSFKLVYWQFLENSNVGYFVLNWKKIERRLNYLFIYSSSISFLSGINNGMSSNDILCIVNWLKTLLHNQIIEIWLEIICRSIGFK